MAGVSRLGLSSMGRPGFKHSGSNAPELPVASFRKVDDEPGARLEGVHDLQAQQYGCKFVKKSWRLC